MKVVAVLLGPAGVGLAGLYYSIVDTAAAMAGLGINQSGTRQIATAHAAGNEVEVGRVRRSLSWAILGLASFGGALFWLARDWIARVLLADPALAPEVGWLAIGVALTVGTGSQYALLTGMRRVGDLARISIGTGLAGAMLGVVAIWLWGRHGLTAMVLVAPLAAFLLGHLYVARLSLPASPRTTFREMAGVWREMAGLGLAFMFSALITMLGHLAVRTLVQRELGAEALGQFQAAWSIGMTYLSFVLSAMTADYYPRLAALIRDPLAAARLVNEQIEVALLLCAPLLLLMLGLAPWVIQLLYTAEFAPAVEILRWYILGYLLKVISIPMGLILLAGGAGRTFIAIEGLCIGIFVLGTFVGLPSIGLTATGVAFVALYLVYLPLVRWSAGRHIQFRWTRAVKIQALMIVGLALGVDVAARTNNCLGAVLGLGLALLTALWALTRLAAKAETSGRLRHIGVVGEWVRACMFRHK